MPRNDLLRATLVTFTLTLALTWPRLATADGDAEAPDPGPPQPPTWTAPLQVAGLTLSAGPQGGLPATGTTPTFVVEGRNPGTEQACADLRLELRVAAPPSPVARVALPSVATVWTWDGTLTVAPGAVRTLTVDCDHALADGSTYSLVLGSGKDLRLLPLSAGSAGQPGVLVYQLPQGTEPE
jgi:hypothetical protein